MTQAHAVYLFDPLCGWCYGASGVLQRLASQPGFAVELAPAGLFSGNGARAMDDHFASYAWANDQRIAQLTGQPFSEAYRQNVLGDRSRAFDSGPATLALTAIAMTTPARELEGLAAMQKARFVEGRDITDTTVLIETLRAIGVHAAADVFAAADAELVIANQHRVQGARDAMRRFGVQGVPTLIIGEGEHRYPVSPTAFVNNFDELLAKLQAA